MTGRTAWGFTADPHQDWRTQAECRGADANLFFPETGGSANPARHICKTCTVRDACLEYALATPVTHDWGVWGATSEDERQQIRRCRTGRCEHTEHRQETPA